MADRTARLGLNVETATDTARMRVVLAIDSSLTSRLGRIVAERGWPGRSLVGDEAATAAFLIVQHSPSDAFQREMLPLLEAAAAAGEAAPADVAMLTDRVRTHEGIPQLYGTQFRIVDGALEPYPIEEPDSLDARRARAGLLPMAEYVKLLARTCGRRGPDAASGQRRGVRLVLNATRSAAGAPPGDGPPSCSDSRAGYSAGIVIRNTFTYCTSRSSRQIPYIRSPTTLAGVNRSGMATSPM